MTTQDIIKKTESFTIEQKQELAYYLLFSTISDDKKQEIMHLFHYKNDFDNEKEPQSFNKNNGNGNVYNSKTKDENKLLTQFADWKQKLPKDLTINEDEFYI